MVAGQERVAGAAAQGDGRVQEAGASGQGVQGLGGLHLLSAFTSHTCCLASHLTPHTSHLAPAAHPHTSHLPSHLTSAAFPPAARPRTPCLTLPACAPTSHLLPHLTYPLPCSPPVLPRPLTAPAAMTAASAAKPPRQGAGLWDQGDSLQQGTWPGRRRQSLFWTRTWGKVPSCSGGRWSGGSPQLGAGTRSGLAGLGWG